MVETKRHGDAFDAYYAMGAERSYAEVGRKLGVSKTSVEKWGREFNWKERVIQRDIEVNKRVEKKTTNAIVNTKADYRADVKKNRDSLEVIRQRFEKLVADATEAIEKGEIKVHDVNELDKVASSLKKLHDLNRDYVKLDLELIGEDPPDQNMLVRFVGAPEGFFDDIDDDSDTGE